MTRATNLKNLRRHNPEKLPEELREVVARDQSTCPVCKYPMYISLGQIQYCHKTCKKTFKEKNK